jgi:hypothetical protein
MVLKKRSDGLPPNFDVLPDDLKREIEEQQYKRQLKWSHGYRPGDPRLRSLSAEGVPVSGSFGKRVDEGVSEEVVA